MSETQLQAIQDVIKMTPRLNMENLTLIRNLMEKAIYNLPHGDVKKLVGCKDEYRLRIR